MILKFPEGQESSGNSFHFVFFRLKVKQNRYSLSVLPTNHIQIQLILGENTVLGVDLGGTLQLHNITNQIIQEFLEIMEV